MNKYHSATLAALICMSASHVSAATLSTQDLLNQFNTVTLGDTTISQEVEGRTYVGGNLIIKNQAQFKMVANTPASNFDSLVVSGNVTGGGAQMQGGSNATVGGNVTNNNFELNGHGTLRVGGKLTANANQGTKLTNQAGTAGFSDRFLDDVVGTTSATSTYLSTLSGTSASVSGNKLSFNAAPTNGTTIYSIDFSQLSSAREIDLGTNGAQTVIINVSGTGGTVSANFLGNSRSAAPNVLWNFYQATSLRATTSFMGSVLATSAAVSNTSPFEGSVIAKSANYDAEVHTNPFIGTIPTALVATPSPAPAPAPSPAPAPAPAPAPSPVPVPAALPLLGSALAGLFLMSRRRRQAA